jgi:hypothetical protein
MLAAYLKSRCPDANYYSQMQSLGEVFPDLAWFKQGVQVQNQQG